MSNLWQWLNQRLPVAKWWHQHATGYYVPKNLNFWYCFGSLALFVLVIQIASGFWLTMYYTPTAEQAFASIEALMREVPYGWLFRYTHVSGASALFIIVYLHLLRSLLYGSYQKPRELVWLLGVMLYLALLAEAAIGYLLPWGQLSFWGTQVLTSLVTVIPGSWGESLQLWLQGGYTISGITLHRFFALHVIGLPVFLFILVWLHLVALREVGSNNPLGIDLNAYQNAAGQPLYLIPFHPYYTVKDALYAVIFLLIFCGVIFWNPDMWGYFLEPDNLIAANPLQTPTDLVAPWYLAPFYAMLRAMPDKLGGVIVVVFAMLIWFALPWLDRSAMRAMRYRGIASKIALGIFGLSFLGLMYLGLVPITPLTLQLARLATICYFTFFVLMPIYTRFDKLKPIDVARALEHG